MTSEAENISICFVFEDIYKNNTVKEDLIKLTQKGLNTLIESSNTRHDNFFNYLKTIPIASLRVHSSCRNRYTKPSSVSAASNKRKMSFGSPPTYSKVKFASEIQDFDYKNHCIICNKVIDTRNLSRHPVKTITNNDFAKDLCDRIDELDVQTVETIVLKNRLLCDDLVANKARYRSCNMSFHNDKRMLSNKTVGRPQTDKVTIAMITIFHYIDNLEDCQFTHQDLAKLFEKDAYFPKLDTITRRLLERYGVQNMKVLNRYGGQTFFLFKGKFI